jgi:sulfur transfer complex TusBCD TusB component (DsrH family)
MQILHLIRKLNDPYPLEIVAAQSREADTTVRVVYLQDAVYRPPKTDGDAYTLEEDCAARGVDSPLERISYERLISLIFQSDRVISW